MSAIRTKRFPRKRDETYFCYKAHLAVDEGSGLARQAQMTSANLHYGRMAEALIQGDEEGYFADKAYDSQVFRDTSSGGGSWTAWPGGSNLPVIRFETWQKRLNAWAGSIRSGVERANATMKR
jgi:transposase, IS5 family